MYKFYPVLFCRESVPIKFLLIMKLTCVLLFAVLLQASAESYAQRVSLEMENSSLNDVFNEIREQTGYDFILSSQLLKRARPLSIRIHDEPLKDALDKCFAGQPLEYFINGNTIIVRRKSTLTAIKPSITPLQPVLQQQLEGIVRDSIGPIPGVSVQIKGTNIGTATDLNGKYTLDMPDEDAILVFSIIGYTTKEIPVRGRGNVINVIMQSSAAALEDVVVVAFGKQKKESVISSIETVNINDLRVPSSNLTTAFAGRMAGVISYQTSGEPGQDNAQFFIRGITSFGTGKVDPLILIDNVEMTTDDLSRMHPDDIQSFSILKDATATALYGARGANGVILVTTKEGKEGKAKISVRFENSISRPTTTIKMADPITYMHLANEATRTRNPLMGLPYSNEKIDNTIRGTNPYVYPAVDWLDLQTKDLAMNQRMNMNISGGGKVARYYIAGSFTQDNGNLEVDKRNDFNNNIDLKQYLIRSNININLTKSTEAIVRVNSTFTDYTGPIAGGSALYQRALKVSPVRFPAYYEPDETFQYANHILFGGYDGENYYNPYAEMVRGYRDQSSSAVVIQMEMKQNFDKWIEGLTGRVLGNITRYSDFSVSRAYTPYNYSVSRYDRYSDTYTLTELNTEAGKEYLSYSPGDKKVSSSVYGEASLAYDRKFNLHNVGGMLVFTGRNALVANASTLIESLPKRNLSLAGRFSYDYDSRYMLELNFGYNGSEKFDKSHRWGFFPSFGAGWNVAEENFWKSNQLNRFISKLKLKGTFGWVGNDEIGSDRFFYLSAVTINDGQNYQSGYDFGYRRTGVRIGNYANSEIGWEVSRKVNLGIELGMFEDKIEILVDLFRERRTDILQTRTDIPSEMGLWAIPQANIGEAEGKGIDISFDLNHVVNNHFWLTSRANFTYARSTFVKYEEPDYQDVPWRSKIGMPIKQTWGYAAERLFIDWGDVANSPRQDFGEYGPGDIKYKDLNEDNVINEIDMVPIGHPTFPEINYGFGLSMGYRGFDFSFFFQGSARSSFWVNASAIAPFKVSTVSDNDSRTLENGLAQFIADDYWSETSQNPYARWPRLSTYAIDNNTKRSTWFMHNGDFLRLKTVEFGYSLPDKMLSKAGLETCRLYCSGTNLLLFSDFDLWDIEMGGNGLGYPLQRVFNLGINISF